MIRYYLAEHAGKQHVRSTKSREYAKASIRLLEVGFHGANAAAPKGTIAMVPAREITAAEYRAISAAHLAARKAAYSPKVRRSNLVRMVQAAGENQAHSGRTIAMLLVPSEDTLRRHQPAERALYLQEAQRRQTMAYRRMLRALVALNAYDAERAA